MKKLLLLSIVLCCIITTGLFAADLFLFTVPESKTRNKIMEPVEQNTAELHEYYRSLGIDTVFELNPGNHFQNPADRLAKGIALVLGDR
ncbi:MAG: hypothetical protein II773_01630 [Oscillospiraceae bacterium]|nr:hypothetical protein [Oscillospiraceae bacterium]